MLNLFLTGLIIINFFFITGMQSLAVVFKDRSVLDCLNGVLFVSAFEHTIASHGIFYFL